MTIRRNTGRIISAPHDVSAVVQHSDIHLIRPTIITIFDNCDIYLTINSGRA